MILPNVIPITTVILIDRQIADLCYGVVPDELRYFYSSIDENVPRKIRPMVDPFLPELVNPASLDIRVGHTAKLRKKEGLISRLIRCFKHHFIAIQNKPSGYKDIDLSRYSYQNPYWMQPGDRILVASLETFNLPDFLCAQFRLKSSRGREFYEHMEAGFCDPGWHGSKLTMEIINMDCGPLPLYPGLKMGQLVFSLTLGTPNKDYSVTGRYNGDRQVEASKGCRIPIGNRANYSVPEPPPKRRSTQSIHDLVIADIEDRKQFGLEKYGTTLQPGNGRRGLVDLYQELLDAAAYCRLLIEENQ